MSDYGFVVASARILQAGLADLRRAHLPVRRSIWRQIAYVARGFQNPLYAEEMNILEFLQQPDVTLVQALLLKFKPVNMDVLPLYIVLMACFRRCCGCCCAMPRWRWRSRSLLYALTWEFDWNLPAYPSGTWYFNPFAWQLLFVFGAWCALGGAERLHGCCARALRLRSRSPICVLRVSASR